MANASNNSSFTGGVFTPARGKTVQKNRDVSGDKLCYCYSYWRYTVCVDRLLLAARDLLYYSYQALWSAWSS